MSNFADTRNMQEFSPQSDLAVRFRNYVILLDRILREVEDELEENRAIRHEWSEWHSNWKKVWLNQTEESAQLRERVSVKFRNRLP
ncbi:hypothetical protein LEP1GSC058_0086 [Leptospira fainei serovar Hurstbridge str. BUT 6]|uniref:Uncharacterized protein n=1 Tax=Leptospira fainei serovar Hurstbridge str. BUT 6 TaxID=1193011 RepID=S3W4I0_9LEPT|nr:hypothetical protein LEP1GSC058_0086 [Leptospira fainei serovar Hurstbridge str. BUT 6]